MTRHLFLAGYRGTGKSSVGRLLANRLSLPLIDLDERIQAEAGTTIREIFAEGGEESFRDMESAALAAVIGGSRSVIALGGGAILRESNRRQIREAGCCIWLDAEPETLAARIAGDSATTTQRPSLTGLSGLEEIRTVYRRRLPLYREVADYRVDTEGKSIDQVAAEIGGLIGPAAADPPG